MIYKDFQDKKISFLAFGAMRLPLSGTSAGEIDEKKVAQMVEYAIENGVNYFDTAYPYHDGMSEIVMGKILENYPRDKFYLATKYPGHQISSSYNPAEVFEDQLKKCRVEYFDFYLLHNVCELSINTYESEKWGIIDYFLEQKKQGRIKHLGFSSHGMPDCLEDFLSRHAGEMEFCQIQLNYLDWTMQDAKKKVEILNKHNIPIWVMEPVHGGKLVNLDEKSLEKLRKFRPDDTPAQLAFRWLFGIPGVTTILSGMSNFEQMKDNVNTFNNFGPLSEEENTFLAELADVMKNTVPCTACRYCTKGCPKNLDIPKLLNLYNDMKFYSSMNVGMALDAMPKEARPSECIACGKCTKICPQSIDVPAAFEEFCAMIGKTVSWEKQSREREEMAKKLRETLS